MAAQPAEDIPTTVAQFQLKIDELRAKIIVENQEYAAIQEEGRAAMISGNRALIELIKPRLFRKKGDIERHTTHIRMFESMIDDMNNKLIIKNPSADLILAEIARLQAKAAPLDSEIKAIQANARERMAAGQPVDEHREKLQVLVPMLAKIQASIATYTAIHQRLFGRAGGARRNKKKARKAHKTRRR